MRDLLLKNLLSWRGNASRLEFFAKGAGMIILSALGLFIWFGLLPNSPLVIDLTSVVYITAAENVNWFAPYTAFMLALLAVGTAAMFWVGLVLYIRRVNDMGLDARWFVPLCYVIYVLLALAGIYLTSPWNKVVPLSGSFLLFVAFPLLWPAQKNAMVRQK